MRVLLFGAVLMSLLGLSVVPAQDASAAGNVTVSKTVGLNAAGDSVRVQGSGFDSTKGIYLALCVQAAKPTVAPGPCGGGAMLEGSDGSSYWISSNPPSYGVGLAIPWGPGGSFDLTMSVSPIIQAATATTPAIDCRVVVCGISTRADHIRSSDRSQDSFTPVTFAGVPPATAPATTAPPVSPTVPATHAPSVNTPAGGNSSSPAANLPSGVPASPGTDPGSADSPVGDGGEAGVDVPVTIPSSLFEDEDGTTSDEAGEAKVKSASEDRTESRALAAKSAKGEAASASKNGGSSGSTAALIVVLAAVVAAAVGAGGFVWNKRRSAEIEQ
ncbi:MAG: hypothetical protein KDB26_15820 [Microthrixaceae bacterium]|nr:hypothetical protein [Microthrixaceae bacterium]